MAGGSTPPPCPQQRSGAGVGWRRQGVAAAGRGAGAHGPRLHQRRYCTGEEAQDGRGWGGAGGACRCHRGDTFGPLGPAQRGRHEAAGVTRRRRCHRRADAMRAARRPPARLANAWAAGRGVAPPREGQSPPLATNGLPPFLPPPTSSPLLGAHSPPAGRQDAIDAPCTLGDAKKEIETAARAKGEGASYHRKKKKDTSGEQVGRPAGCAQGKREEEQRK